MSLHLVTVLKSVDLACLSMTIRRAVIPCLFLLSVNFENESFELCFAPRLPPRVSAIKICFVPVLFERWLMCSS